MDNHDKEIVSIHKELNHLMLEISKKLTVKDGQRIWKHFQRFSEYNDLRDLYNKVIPEIAKFEEKILVFGSEIEMIRVIIRKFDENITNKCDKL